MKIKQISENKNFHTIYNLTENSFQNTKYMNDVIYRTHIDILNGDYIDLCSMVAISAVLQVHVFRQTKEQPTHLHFPPLCASCASKIPLLSKKIKE